ncbi:MAG: LAGLIDADG family homing endonuclease [Candidatus Diapherotrites archaeon]
MRIEIVITMVNYRLDAIVQGISQDDVNTINKINLIRKESNFQKVRKSIGDKKLIKLINNLYPQNDIKALEKIFNVPDSSLSYWFKQLGVKSRRRHINNLAIPANFSGSSIFMSREGSTNISAIPIDKDLSYLVGFCLGDGAVQKYCVEVFNKDEGMKEYLKGIMEKYGKIKETVRQDGLWKIKLSSVKIADLIKRNKIEREDTIMHILSEDLLAQNFLAGFWDAEGSVLKQKKYFHVYLYNSNKRLLDNISNYLNECGIKNSMLKMKKRSGAYYLNNRIIRAKKTVYRLGIPKKYLRKWVETIGLYLKHSKKSVVVKKILEESD